MRLHWRPPFIRECRVLPDFLAVLAHYQQLLELELFVPIL